MGFLAFTFIGIAAALVHIVLPGEHHVGAASALAVGVFGAWGGGLFIAAFHQGGWTMFGTITVLGAALGAAGSIELLELVADAHFRHDEERGF